MCTTPLYSQEPNPNWAAYRPQCKCSTSLPDGEDGRNAAEDGCQEPFQAGSLTRILKFVLEKDFIKSMPYTERFKQ
jgi:hypothetical protein